MSSTHSASTIEAFCVDFVSRMVGQPKDKIDPNVEVERLGLDSSTGVALIMSLEDELDAELMPGLLMEYPTLSGLSTHLAARMAARETA